MIGQKELLQKIDSYTIKTFPRTSLFLGDIGCGKHTLIKYISTKYNIDAIDITSKISYEYLSSLILASDLTIYYIDMTQLTEKQQNIILKTIEEPCETAIIILLSTNTSYLLPTIQNRCITFEFQKYSKEELTYFLNQKNNDVNDVKNDTINNISIFSICQTPGQILLLQKCQLNEMADICNKIVTKLSKASFQNTLSLSKKFKYDESATNEKIDINLFLKMLLTFLKNDFIINNNDISNKLYNIVSKDYKKLLIYQKLNKEYFMNSLLIDMWKCARGVK